MGSILKPLVVELTLCNPSVLGATEDFPLKRVPLLTYVVDYEASWSPDGRQIVLISNRHGGMKALVLDAGSDQNGSDMRQITAGPNEDDSPAWSPDGRQIAVVSDVSDIFAKTVRLVTPF
jgi:Tol biopolymer transport system component